MRGGEDGFLRAATVAILISTFVFPAIIPADVWTRPWKATAEGYPLPDARAAGMGGSFAALATDPSALVWNPAGLTDLTFPAISGDFSLGGPGTSSILLGYPIGSYTGAGFGWMRHDDIPQTGGTPTRLERFAFGMAGRLGDRLSVGVSASYMNPRWLVAPDSVEEAVGVSLSTGAIVSLTQRLRFGIALYDVADTKVSRANGAIVPLSRRSIRWGLAYTPHDRFALTWQHDAADRFGMEWYPVRFLGIRGGTARVRGDWEYALGLSLRFATLRTDYAFVDSRVGPDAHRMSVQTTFTGGRTAVQMDNVQLRALYASLANVYARDPIGSVVLLNPSPAPVLVRVELTLPGVLAVPTAEEITVPPYSRRRVYFRAALSPDVTDALSNGPIPGAIALVNPISETVWRRQAVQTYYHRSGAITWDDTRKAAAFVTPDDPAVRAFVREALKPYRSWLRGLPEEQEVITTAMILMEAAAAQGITYQADPNTPYADARRNVGAVDMIREIGEGTFDVAKTPVGMVVKPVKSAVSGSADSANSVDSALYETSNMVTRLGSIGEESLRLLLYPYQRFVSPSDLQMVVDDIQYPAQILASRAGDCDDTSVLVCALLESAGISTAFMESPEHIYMMFDTRLIATEGTDILPGPPDLFVKYRGTYWIPLETTAIGEGFMASWRRSAATTASIVRGDSIPATPIADAWQLYEPVTIPAGENAPIVEFSADSLDGRVRMSRIAIVDLWKESLVGKRLARDLEAHPDDHRLRAELAFWLLHAGYLPEVDRHLASLEEAGYEPPRTLGLRAVYWFQAGDLARSEECAREAVERAPWVADLRVLLDQVVAARALAPEGDGGAAMSPSSAP